MTQIFMALDSKYQLAHSIARSFGQPLIILPVTTFADGEIEVALPSDVDVRHAHIILIHPLSRPVHDNFFKLCSALHAVRAAGAAHITAVIPYFGYARHDVDAQGAPGLFATVVKMLEAAGMDACVMVELHEKSTLRYFSVPVVNVTLDEVWEQHIKQMFKDSSDVCLVSPDTGGAQRIHDIAEKLQVKSVVFEKQRTQPDMVDIAHQYMLGSCATAIIIDDMIDTGRTAFAVGQRLQEQQVQEISAFFVHPVCAQPAIEIMQSALFTKIVVTNTIELPAMLQNSVQVIDIGGHVAQALKIFLDKKE